MKHKQVPQPPSPASMWIAIEETQPLPGLREMAFRAFLIRHKLSLLDVALAAGVRLLTVWNVEQDYPISRQHAEKVRVGLHRLTGVDYRGGITVHLGPTFRS